MAALGSTTAERQHMNKAYSHNDHHWGVTIKIKRLYHVKHLYNRSDRTCLWFFFFENRAVCEKMWKNIVERGRPQVTVWRMSIACWIPKAIDVHSEYVMLRFVDNSDYANALQCDVMRTFPVWLHWKLSFGPLGFWSTGLQSFAAWQLRRWPFLCELPLGRTSQQYKNCACDILLWRVRVTIVSMATTMTLPCIVAQK
jgi:hypothetical protein